MATNVIELDAVVVGAGFSGMYMLHLLREMNLNVKAIEVGEDVGGVWYFNRDPGLRCDSESVFFNYTFSKELYEGWTWSSKYPEQPEILSYLNYVADTLDLRNQTKVEAAVFNEQLNKWDIEASTGEKYIENYFISGIGTLSDSNVPNMKGLENFKGEWHHTPVDFTNKRVGVIGTGSSGIQIIPKIAETAKHLTVFQRTPQYSIPARNRPLDAQYVQSIKADFENFVYKTRYETFGGAIMEPPKGSALDVTAEERTRIFEEKWQIGGPGFLYGFNDIATNPEANEYASEFVRQKIKETVKDEETARKLLPSYPIGTKRIVIDTDYFETYNRENVSLHDSKADPVVEITSTGIQTKQEHVELDMIVFATGYDALTGPLLRIDIRGRDGKTLNDKWQHGKNLKTLLGLANNGFPNMFTITGPQSPAVLGNVPILIEQHVEWVADCIRYMEEKSIAVIEATVEAEEQWTQHTNDVAKLEFYSDEDSWYTGANIDGKEKNILVYRGGLPQYRERCDDIANNAYKGFKLLTLSE